MYNQLDFLRPGFFFLLVGFQRPQVERNMKALDTTRYAFAVVGLDRECILQVTAVECSLRVEVCTELLHFKRNYVTDVARFVDLVNDANKCLAGQARERYFGSLDDWRVL